MSRANDWRSGWVTEARRIAATPRAPAVAGALMVLLAVTESIARAASSGWDTQFALAVCVLAVFITLPLVVLGPVAAAVAASAASVLSLALFHTLSVAAFAAQLIVLYQLGRNGPQRKSAQFLATGLAFPFLALALAGPRPTGSEAGVLTVLLASLAPVSAWAGIARRARSEAKVHSAAQQAVAGILLEHAARGERARIAHELHDIVAHHISMVAVQADTARLTTPGMPAAGAQRLSAIGDSARAALTEMRRLLGVLREDAQIDVADRKPQPGLKELNDLLDEARDVAGTGTRLILRGSTLTLDPVVELATYRIVQEALTNARRHAPGAAVDVELNYADDALRLRIRDNGPGPPSAAPFNSHGLLGMRERVAAVGGELRTGPATGGGFLVEAILPAQAKVLR